MAIDTTSLVVRLVSEKYELQEQHEAELAKAQEELESTRVTCNYIGKQYQSAFAKMKLFETMIQKAKVEAPDLDWDGMEADVQREVEQEEAAKHEIESH